jgi:hypothetical protein
MTYSKMLGIAAVAVAALMAFVGTASATILEDSEGKMPASSFITFEGTSNAVFKAGFATIQCTFSHLDGVTTNAGGASETVVGSFSDVRFTTCGSATVTVLKKGAFSIHHTSSSNGTVTSEGLELTVATGGTSCTYGTPTATTIGTLTGGSSASFSASASLARVAGGFLCANPATWTGTYATVPFALYVTSS